MKKAKLIMPILVSGAVAPIITMSVSCGSDHGHGDYEGICKQKTVADVEYKLQIRGFQKGERMMYFNSGGAQLFCKVDLKDGNFALGKIKSAKYQQDDGTIYDATFSSTNIIFDPNMFDGPGDMLTIWVTFESFSDERVDDQATYVFDAA